MSHTSVFRSSGLTLALTLCLGAMASLGLGHTVHAAQAAKKSQAVEPITLNFVNAEIESVARTLATLSNKNLVVDPRVKGTINLSTERPVPPLEAWAQFLAALRLQGFAVVETQGLFKVVPEADAKLQGGSVEQIDSPNAQRGASGGQVVTQIFKLNFENANNLVPVLRPLISPNNTINVNPGNNSLVITDYADNLQRIARIVAALDVSNASDVEVIALKHAIAVDLAPLVLRLIDANASAGVTPGAAPNPGGTGSDYKTTLLAEPRSNALILRAANPARAALVRSLVEKLDQPGSSNPSGNIHVVYLKNADATKLATTLRAALNGSNTSSTTGTNNSFSPATSPTNSLSTSASGATNSTTPNNAATTGGQIQADTATNSLIITAPEPQYRQLRAVIDMLDQRRAQVMVESLIAEVNADKALQMGIQWQGALGSNGVAGTNFGSTGNIVGLSQGGTTAATAGIGAGMNIGTIRNVNGTTVLSSLANFLETNGDANILSTPNLLTLDNEEAKIVVGQNVPFITGSYSNPTTAGTNPFQTVERKDVGLTLKVKPQISETGTVKMTVFQEVSSVDYSKASTIGLITNKRSIESNVLVDDGSIIVLGGLLSDEYTGNASKVPGLGDIPGLGWLFKSESRTRSKKNLMVFLRPVVVRDAAATDALSTNRYQQMMGLQRNAVPSFNPLLETGPAPVLPPLTPKTAPATTAPATTSAQ